MSQISDMDDFLEHYGRKGMKWGVVNEDKGSGDTSTNKQLKSELKSFSDKQKYGSMNDPEPKIEDQPFYKRLTPGQKKAALIFGGAVVVSGVAYGAHKYSDGKLGDIGPTYLLDKRDPFDGLTGVHGEGFRAYQHKGIDLPAGTLVARVSSAVETKIRPGGFYAAHDYDDVESYKSFLGSVGGHTNYFEALKPIKVPSTTEYARLLGKAMDHPDILKERKVNVKALNRLNPKDRDSVLYRLGANELKRRDFAFSLNASTVDGLLPKRFVNEVKKAGFTSVIDYNNASAHVAKAPLRHLDGSMFKFKANEPITAEVKQLAGLNKDKVMDKIADFYDGVGHSLLEGMDDYLEQSGIKGMKWGVRKRNPNAAAFRARAKAKKGPSPEHLQTKKLQRVAKKSGTKALTNKELDQVAARLNKEKKFKDLNPSSVKKGQNIAKAAVGTATFAASVYTLAKSPAGKAGAAAVKKAMSK